MKACKFEDLYAVLPVREDLVLAGSQYCYEHWIGGEAFLVTYDHIYVPETGERFGLLKSVVRKVEAVEQGS